MLYEEYRRKMLKIANIKRVLRRYRVLIVAVLAALVALTAAFLSVRGIVYDCVHGEESVVYGERPAYSAKALFGRVSYEYAPADSDDWTFEFPKGIGEYKVRGVASRTFGAPSYGEEYAFTVVPKRIEVGVAAASVVYGEAPPLSAALAEGDRIECSSFEYGDESQKTTSVTPVAEAVAVYDDGGKDVTECYVIGVLSREISFTPRQIAIEVAPAERVYDGSAFSSREYELKGTLAKGDSLQSSFGCSLIDAGEAPNEPQLKILSEKGADVTENYRIDLQIGTLRVLKRPLHIGVFGAEKVYDGTPLSRCEYAVASETPLLTGHTLSLLSGSSLTDAGTIENELSFRISDGGGRDVTGNYELTFPDCGKLTVIPRPVVVRTGGAEKIYDGTALKCSEYEVVSPASPLAGHTLAVTISGAQTTAGASGNVVSATRIIASDGADVTKNYMVSYEYGELKVFPREVTVRTQSASWIYDGKPHSDTRCEVVSENKLVAGQTMRAEIAARLTDCGAVENSFSVRVFDGTADVSSSYSLSYEYGELKVIPRPVTVRSGDKDKIYDGTPLTDGEYVVTSQNKLAEGQEGRISCVGTQTDAGSSANTVVGFRVFDGEKDVTRNYALTLEAGTLTVLPRPIAVHTGDGTWIYDGEARFVKTCETVSELSLIEGHSLAVTEYARIEDAGQVPNVLTVRVYDGKKDVTRNYDISYVYGSLEVTPRPISIKTASAEWIYDGARHFAATYEIFSDLSPALVKGHTAAVAGYAQIEDAGEIPNAISVSIFGGDKDVTGNYAIAYDCGTLQVVPRPVTVRTADGEWMYDGTAHFAAEYEIVSSLSPVLVEGHEASVAENKFVEDAGEYANDMKIAVFAGERDVTANYAFEYVCGTLTVQKRPVTVTAGSSEKIYDGTPLTYYAALITSELTPILVNSHRSALKYQGSQTDAGTSANKVTEFWVFDGNRDVTNNYEITKIDGTLTVTPRPILVTAGSAEKIYDGEPLTSGKYEVTSELSFALVKGQRGQVTNKGSQTDAGSSKNSVMSFAVFDGKRDVTANYEATYAEGTLTVQKRPIRVAAENASKTYDGTPLVRHAYRIDSQYKLVYGHTLQAFWEGSQTDAGSCVNRIFDVAVYADERDVSANYEITCENGLLTVIPISLRCLTEGAEKLYDGTELRKEGWEFIEGATLENHTLTIRGTRGAITYPGYCYNEPDYTVVDNDTQRDVSHNYSFALRDLGILRILPIEITVKTGSARKVYDGEPLVCGDWTLLEGEFYEGYVTEIRVTGWRKWIGSERNWAQITAWSPSDGYVSRIYEVTWIYGALTVLPNPALPGEGLDPNQGGSGGSGGGGGGGGESSGQISAKPGSDGGSGEGEGSVLFKALSDTDGRIYFRSKSFGEYVAGYGWLDAQAYVGKTNPLNFSSLALDASGKFYSQVNITRVSTALPYLVPYYAGGSSGWEEDDTQVFGGNWNSYTRYYIPYEYSAAGALSLQGSQYEAPEKIYRKFVHEYYVDLPEDTKNALLQAAKKSGLNADDPEIVEKVAKLVQRTVEYDLSFEEYEDDFAVYFFTKARKGICQHYATAATAMYRALGIPARYVTGFVRDLKAEKTSTVIARQAHAWVEVYIDGMGWVQVEVTGSGFDSGGSGGAGEGETGDLVDSLGSFTVKPIDVDKEYDGTPLYAENKVEGLVFEELLALGYTYDVTVTGQRTDYGESESSILHFVIYDPRGNEVTDSFSFTLEKGSILITKPQILVRVYTLQKYYDGAPLSYRSGDYRIEKIPENYRLDLELQGSLTEAGKLSLRKLSNLPMTVYDGYGNDVTQEYYVKFVGEPLRVDRRAIEVASVSRAKEYDGKPLKGDFAWISKGSLAKGHKIEFELFSQLIDVGSIPNTIQNVRIYDEKGNVVTRNYRIAKKAGTLTVERPA